MSEPKKRNIVRWVIFGFAGICLLFAGGAAYVALQIIEGGPNQEGGIMGQPTVGGPFVLVNGDGETVTEKAFDGKVMAVYFGFTYCPDVCPTELAIVADAIDLLPANVAAKVAPLFITIDPDRDTPELVKEYAANFHENMVGLTGTPEQIAAAGKAYRVYYAKRETESGSYTMDHTSYIYIMDKQGRYYRHFRMNSSPEEIAEALKAAVAG
jgi:cytochrome oxidase Cu insertion factor (SCO1/SenC/PrrC family)